MWVQGTSTSTALDRPNVVIERIQIQSAHKFPNAAGRVFWLDQLIDMIARNSICSRLITFKRGEGLGSERVMSKHNVTRTIQSRNVLIFSHLPGSAGEQLAEEWPVGTRRDDE